MKVQKNQGTTNQLSVESTLTARDETKRPDRKTTRSSLEIMRENGFNADHLSSSPPSSQETSKKNLAKFNAEHLPKEPARQERNSVTSLFSCVYGYHAEQDQSFVEIHAGLSSVGDVSWVKGEDSPVLTLEPNTSNKPWRLSVKAWDAIVKEAIETLGPRED